MRSLNAISRVILAGFWVGQSVSAEEIQIQGKVETTDSEVSPSGFGIAPEFLIAFPQPLQLGAEMRFAPESPLRTYFCGGYFVFPISGGAGHFKEASVQGGIRYFPGNSWFFGQAGFGYRYMGLSEDTSSLTIDDQVVATNGAVGMHTLFARVAAGVQFHISRKVLMGMDVGYQLPLLAAARLTLSDSTTGQNSNTSGLLAVDSTGLIRIARLSLPEITLMRLTVQLD